MPDIFDIVKEAIPFERYCNDKGIKFNSGKKTTCPFHPDENPSFHNYGTHGYCFSCGKHADIIDLEARRKGISPWEAALSLAKDYSVPLPDFSPKDKERFDRQQKAFELIERTSNYANRNIHNHPEIKKSLRTKRGIDDNDIDNYGLGYVGDNNPVATNVKDERDIEIALEIGLIHKGNNGRYYHHFRNRIIIPILKYGKVVFLTGRAFPDSTITDNNAKYLHLKTSDLIQKEIYLSENINKVDCLIVEGVFDAIALDKAGFDACALLGTNPGEHARDQLLKSKSTKYIAFDSDDAGEKASYDLAKELRGSILNTGYEKDFDELLAEHGIDKFKDIVEKAMSEAEYYLDAVIENEDIRIAKEEIAKLEDECERDIYIGKLYEKHKEKGIKKSSIESDIKSIKESTKEDIKPSVIGDRANGKNIAVFEGLIDLVIHEGLVAFLVKDNDKLEIKDSINIDGETYYPPLLRQLPNKLLLPRADKVINHYLNDSDSKLFDDLITYHKLISQLPSEDFYSLLTIWNFHTYVLDQAQVQYSPYLWLYAIPERGKSRTGKAGIYVAYRGLHVESLRDAYLIRIANDLGATVFFDVMDLWKKAERAGSEDILLQRFEKGAVVARVLYPEKGAHKDMKYFDIFGATIIGTNEPVHNILETRAVLVSMPESFNEYEQDVTPEFALPLKERLVAFRARNLNTELPEIKKPIRGRLGDILKPLLQVLMLVKPEKEKDFRRIIFLLDKDRKIQKSDSLEARLLLTIMSLEEQVNGGKLHVKTITDKYNETIKEKFHISPHKTGWRLKAMGFKKDKDGDGAYIDWNDELITSLSERYGLTVNSDSVNTQQEDSQNTPTYGKTARHNRHNRHLFNDDSKLDNDDLSNDFTTSSQSSEDRHNLTDCKYEKNDNHDDNDDVFGDAKGDFSQADEMARDTSLCTGCWKIRIACICN